MAYFSIFTAAFLAATLLPAQSEALLAGLVLNNPADLLALVAIATLGNTLGSYLNWWLGRSLAYFKTKHWFPFPTHRIEQAQQRFQRYGLWSLWLSWLPIIGDPLTLIAGVLRVPWWQFLPIVALAKGSRYGVLAYLTLYI